ncbi:MAG TPA: TadE/TadG family type IV pilus assembly protein [Gaiellaceae bacterium]|nr:TadE/TadG family type IV pilus assembly protein [Gaiellaceae bacterium]
MRRRHHIDNEEGQAFVEFALVAPILLLVLFGIIQFGIAFMHSVALTDAVRAGARKAAVSRTAADPTAAASSAILGAATDLDRPTLSRGITVTPGAGGWVAGGSVTVEAKYPYKINILGLVVASGQLHSATTERIE